MRIAKGRQFEKQYKKLSPKIQKHFAVRLRLFLEDKNHPLLHVHSLAGKYEGLHSFNVSGDIRVIFDKSFDNVIVLEAIGSHSELYE